MAEKAKFQETVNFIRDKFPEQADLAMILGSGLGILADAVEDKKVIDYKDIPNFPVSTVEGHAGQLVFGRLEGKKVLLMNGRFHYYEGYHIKEVVYPVRVMQLLGIKILLVTNAAGGINHAFAPGDLMIIEDHINLMGTNPLLGPNEEEFGPRFPDMSEAYNKGLRKLAERVAKEEKIEYRKGVYAGLAGPSYETPAEIKYLRYIGADAVGMSTVPEVIVANHGGMRVLGISCITNMAAGVLPQKLSHEEVMETANRVRDKFIKLVRGIVREVKI
ncbi:purine-nucleoside phosphorylase [Thermincola potens]|uniref:Purine nucleoside phosphorylase n=1 Tax=Thermincola potens (strain JR) TaxID=635013 RepID=D5X7E3_THEPJ|nr:purine-nucleoside phosphorylase [Thermincola potens]ADG82513.1 purine nucleoside phosphorylase I, inosine and guanosine-specific [Thermincola potens JR]